MAKKLPISSDNSTGNSLNIISRKINKTPNIKIKLYDSTNKPVDNYAELKKNFQENKLDIILTFSVNKLEAEIEEEEFPVAVYMLKNRDSEEKYLENKKEALIENLCQTKLEVGDEKIEFEDKEKNLNNLDRIKCLIKKAPSDSADKKDLDIKITADSQEYTIHTKNIRLFAYFNLPKKIEYDELITFPSPPKKPESF